MYLHSSVPLTNIFLSYTAKPIVFFHDGNDGKRYCDRVNRLFELWEYLFMARGKQSKKKAQAFDQIQFVDVSLSKTEKDTFTVWVKEKLDDAVIALAELAGSGHKVTLSHDDDHDTFIFSITCKDETNPNHNCCMISRHREPVKAILLGMYKVSVLCDYGAWREDEEDDWG